MNFNFSKSASVTLFCFFIAITGSSCTFSGGTKKSNGAAAFITGAVAIDKVQNVHIINIIRAIGAPNNSVVVGGYKYYHWQHSRNVGVSTLFGGGSTTLYCNLTAETQANKIKLINWFGNQCSIFLDPMGEYFSNKLNIAVITDESEKKQNEIISKNNADSEQKNTEHDGKPAIDLRQKSSEQKALEQNMNEPKVAPSDGINLKQNNIPAIDQKQKS